MEIIKQQDIRDCGIVVIQSFYKKIHKKHIKINALKMKVDFGQIGISINNFMELSSSLGMDAEAYEVAYEDLDQMKEHFVTLINTGNENHYVIAKFKSNHVLVLDPVEGKVKYSFKNFKEMYQGNVIIMSKSETKPENISLSNPFKYLSKNHSLTSWIILSILIEIVAMFLAMTFMKAILDYVIPGMLEKTLAIVILTFVWLAILRTINSFIKEFLVQKFVIKIKYDITKEFFWKINNGDMKMLNKLERSDYLRRMNIIDSTAMFISQAIFTVFNQLLMFAIATSVLLWISPLLFAVTLITGSLISMFTLISQGMIGSKYDELLKENLEHWTSSIDNISTIDQMRFPSYSHNINAIREHRYEKVAKSEFSIWWIFKKLGSITHGLESIAPVMLTYVAVKQIFASELSVGSLILFITVFRNFISPIKAMSELLFSFKEHTKNIELLSFVMNIEDENINHEGAKVGNIESIEFYNEYIGYDRELGRANVVFDQDTQITGVNGSGKTTMLKKIAFIFASDNMKVNTLEIHEHNLAYLRKQVFYSSVNDQLPSVSIIEYLTDNNLSRHKQFIDNYEKYNLGKLMSDLDINLNLKIINGGDNLSSGQKQIVKILKLFTKQYKLIVLDEAFENIDAKKVSWFKKSLTQFQKGIFIEVSHSKKYLSKKRNEVQIGSIINSNK